MNFRTPGLGGQVWQRIGATVVNLARGRDLRGAAVGRARRGRVRRPLQRPRTRLPPGPQALLSLELHRARPRDRARRQQGEVPGASGRPAGDRPDRLPGRVRPGRLGLRRQRSRGAEQLVTEHGVTAHAQFPDEILEAAAIAAAEIFTEMRSDRATS